MKNLILILTVLLITSCGVEPNRATAHIDEELIPYIREFQEDCEIYGWDPKYLYRLRTIEISDDLDVNGITYLNSGEIYINYNLLDNETGLRMVIYHELAHWYGLDHIDYGIMQPNYDECDCLNEDFEENWTEYVEYMMVEQEKENSDFCGHHH